jgi:hypothetical protein
VAESASPNLKAFGDRPDPHGIAFLGGMAGVGSHPHRLWGAAPNSSARAGTRFAEEVDRGVRIVDVRCDHSADSVSGCGPVAQVSGVCSSAVLKRSHTKDTKSARRSLVKPLCPLCEAFLYISETASTSMIRLVRGIFCSAAKLTSARKLSFSDGRLADFRTK